VPVDGSSHAQRITPWGFSDDDGSWSPDGRRIAFEHNGRLYTVHPNGRDLELVRLHTGTRYYAAGDFSWSPDGRRIAFLLFTWNNANGPFREGIATADTDGDSLRLVTTSPTFDHSANWGTSGN
jgi:Tol biopolymer transport system component